jgi:outer membrane immunogenic protein
MKRILVGVAAVASLVATSALAADMPAPVYTKAPIIPVVVYDWTGFYIGGNIGYSWGRSSTDLGFSNSTGGGLLATPGTFNMDGVIGGGQIGYNWQRDKWVFGLEADIQGSGQQGSMTGVCPGNTTVFTRASNTTAAAVAGTCSAGFFGDTGNFNVGGFPVTDTLSQKLDWFGTVRGRVGPTLTPALLVYATGGLAYGGVKYTDTIIGTNLIGFNGTNTIPTAVPVAASVSNSTTNFGWTAGAGVEGAIGGNWTAKLEYLYIDLGNVSGTLLSTIVSPTGGFVYKSYSSHVTDNILRVGINYRFGAAPVVAKY